MLTGLSQNSLVKASSYVSPPDTNKDSGRLVVQMWTRVDASERQLMSWWKSIRKADHLEVKA